MELAWRVVVGLNKPLHGLDPDQQVFPIIRSLSEGRISVTGDGGDNAQVVATVLHRDYIQPQEAARRIEETVRVVGLEATSTEILTKEEYDQRLLADVEDIEAWVEGEGDV